MDPSKYLAKTELISRLLKEARKRKIIFVAHPHSQELIRTNVSAWGCNDFSNKIFICVDEEKSIVLPAESSYQAFYLGHEIKHLENSPEFMEILHICRAIYRNFDPYSADHFKNGFYGCLYLERMASLEAIRLVLEYGGIPRWEEIFSFYELTKNHPHGCIIGTECPKRKEIEELDKSFNQLLFKQIEKDNRTRGSILKRHLKRWRSGKTKIKVIIN